MYGRKMNPMYGYRQDMGNAVARESLTILPQNRALPVHINGGSESVLGIRYEIRSLDYSVWWRTPDWIPGKSRRRGSGRCFPYRTCLRRIGNICSGWRWIPRQWEPSAIIPALCGQRIPKAQTMIDLAVDFSERTFHYDQAQGLVTYMEPTSTEDNSSFGHTCIHSSFSPSDLGGD